MKALVDSQEPLGKEFQRVLDDNRWDLYLKGGEPVKVPSNTDIDELSREWGLQSAAYPSKSMVRNFARALLARYGQEQK